MLLLAISMGTSSKILALRFDLSNSFLIAKALSGCLGAITRPIPGFSLTIFL